MQACRPTASRGMPTTSTPSTLTGNGDLPRLDAQHLGRLSGQHCHWQIEWTLGGKKSSFKFGPRAEFQWQHDVAFGRRLPIDHDVRRPLLPADRRRHLGARRPAPLAGSCSMWTRDAHRDAGGTVHRREPVRNRIHGRHAATAKGNTFVGWGSEPYFSEYGRSGQQLLEANFPGHDLSYRETLEPWVGLPLTVPAGAARQADGQDHGVCKLERSHPGRGLAGTRGIRRR